VLNSTVPFHRCSSWYDHRSIPTPRLSAELVLIVINVVYTVRLFLLPDVTHLPEVKIESQLINILGAVSDVAIAAAMVKLLYDSRTGFKTSDGVINRMVPTLLLLQPRALMDMSFRCSSYSTPGSLQAYVHCLLSSQ
jgi:hypothetical protein